MSWVYFACEFPVQDFYNPFGFYVSCIGRICCVSESFIFVVCYFYLPFPKYYYFLTSGKCPYFGFLIAVAFLILLFLPLFCARVLCVNKLCVHWIRKREQKSDAHSNLVNTSSRNSIAFSHCWPLSSWRLPRQLYLLSRIDKKLMIAYAFVAGIAIFPVE